MDKRLIIWLIILALLAVILGYLTLWNNTTTSTTTTTLQVTSTLASPTTTRMITRPTQPTTTQLGATTLQATTLPGTSTTTTTLPSSNATTSSTTATTQPDHTNPQTTTTSTTLSGATTNPTTTTTVSGATTSTTTTQISATTTTLSGTTTTTTFGATTTTSSTTLQSTTTSSTTRTTTTTTSTTTRTTTTTTRTTTTTTRTTTTTTRTTTTLAGGPIIGGVQVYPRDHIWNTPVDKLPLDPKSATYISAAGSSANLYVYTGYYLNTADKNTPRYSLNFRYRSDAGPYSIPPNPLIETRSSDHALFVLEKDSKVFYQIFDAVKNSDGTWGTCGSGAVFDLSTYALRPDGWTSDAAGLNFLPGLLTYDEVASGEIKHALRITTWNSQNKHIWPARHDAGIADTSLPPMGQRFRLKASVDISKYTPQQQVILRAMKKYGMMLADNSGNKNIWGLSAVSDSRWDFDYTTFRVIHGSDFEAVDVSSLMIDKDSGQARQL